MDITFHKAIPENRAALESLLLGLSLPVADLPADLTHFTLAFDGSLLVGSAGVEPVGNVGLLRSVAVAESYRNLGLAGRLFNSSIADARTKGISEIWLITNTADNYFERHGFERVERENAPGEIADTSQFKGLCPSSAVVMRKLL
ncbi:MAG TPA: arsenic resistance N-acetyltransferase ArsN2 [Saprospiraceae bacterium]|nr:arsenic resistance N-acetyltransferase ArsN2 [Saprospiraceae bacterium]HPI04828.1 arsenic resistance N-acetyltransferase ArsN2 [Saprospiraceae bacterium]